MRRTFGIFVVVSTLGSLAARTSSAEEAGSVPAGYGITVAHGADARAYLGVRIEDVSPELAEDYGLPVAHGALVFRVDEGTPAEAAGLRGEDIILQVNEHDVADAEDLVRCVTESEPGDKVTLIVWRAKEAVDVTVIFGALSDPSKRI